MTAYSNRLMTPVMAEGYSRSVLESMSWGKPIWTEMLA